MNIYKEGDVYRVYVGTDGNYVATKAAASSSYTYPSMQLVKQAYGNAKFNVIDVKPTQASYVLDTGEKLTEEQLRAIAKPREFKQATDEELGAQADLVKTLDVKKELSKHVTPVSSDSTVQALLKEFEIRVKAYFMAGELPKIKKELDIIGGFLLSANPDLPLHKIVNHASSQRKFEL